MSVNVGQPDPLTNRRLSDDCWNGRHWRRRKKHETAKTYNVCQGYRLDGQNCECLCHEEKKLVEAEKGLTVG